MQHESLGNPNEFSQIIHCWKDDELFYQNIYCHVLAYCIVTAQFTLHIWLNYNTKLKIFVKFIYFDLFIVTV